MTVFARHTRVFVFKGVVVVVNADPKVKGRVGLHKNQSSTVWEGEPPSPPEGFEQWLDDFISGGGSGSEDEESAKGGTSGDEQTVESEPLPPPGSEATPTGITPTPPSLSPVPPRDDPPASSGPPQGPPDTPVGPDDTPHGPPPEHPWRGKGKDK